MRYFKNPTTNEVHGYDESIPGAQPYIDDCLKNNWNEVTGNWPPNQTQAETVTLMSIAIQHKIDAGAQAWGYDNVNTAASYTNSTVAQYAADAKALIGWRDAVWQWAIPQFATLPAGTDPNTFVTGMPAQPAKPVA